MQRQAAARLEGRRGRKRQARQGRGSAGGRSAPPPHLYRAEQLSLLVLQLLREVVVALRLAVALLQRRLHLPLHVAAGAWEVGSGGWW